MSMLRQAGAAGRSTTGIRGYGSPRSRGRQKWARSYSPTSSRTSERSERDPGPITTNGYVARTWGPQAVQQHASVVMGPRVRGDDKSGRGAIPSRRPGQVSAANAIRDP